MTRKLADVPRSMAERVFLGWERKWHFKCEGRGRQSGATHAPPPDPRV